MKETRVLTISRSHTPHGFSDLTIKSKAKILLEISNISITFEALKYSELLRLLKQDGWFVIRQTGSHLIMKHHVKSNQVIVPFHGSKELTTGMLRKILKDAEIKTRKG